ncbi:MAG: DUF2892 domain-containing protein [Bdellovibrionales bacterium]
MLQKWERQIEFHSSPTPMTGSDIEHFSNIQLFYFKNKLQAYKMGQINLSKRGSTVEKNEGTIDRTIRVLAGVGILSMAFIGPETAWGYIGIVPIVTGLVGFCPLYKVLGISTCSINNK